MRNRASAWFTFRLEGLQILRAAALENYPWLVHGFSTRAGGTSRLAGKRVLNLGHTDWDTRSHVRANRAKLLGALGAEQMKLVTVRQLHSDMIHELTEAPAKAISGDALITRTPGLVLGVQTADCVAILLVDPHQRAVAAIHAGWRGTLRRLAAKTLGRMQMVFGTRAEEVIAVLGPAIGQCCYEVGPEVAQGYAGQFSQARKWFDGPFDQLAAGEDSTPLKWLTRAPPGHEPPPSRVRLDLLAANHWQLVDAGVKPSNIVASDLCTACRTDLFFSYRRELGCTGRMLAVIGLTAE